MGVPAQKYNLNHCLSACYECTQILCHPTSAAVHPGPLPQGEGERSPATGEPEAPDPFESWIMRLPLPEGLSLPTSWTHLDRAATGEGFKPRRGDLCIERAGTHLPFLLFFGGAASEKPEFRPASQRSADCSGAAPPKNKRNGSGAAQTYKQATPTIVPFGNVNPVCLISFHLVVSPLL